jgi:hypothetical protein
MALSVLVRLRRDPRVDAADEALEGRGKSPERNAN